MVSDQYRVNVVDAMESERVRNKKGSISNPIPNEEVKDINVLEYFGIATADKLEGYTMQAHDRLSVVLQSNSTEGDHPAAMNRIPERVFQEGSPMKGGPGDRSSTSSSFSAWRSNSNNPIYSSRIDDLWARAEYWFHILKWPLVLLLICSILGIFIYFLVAEMEINESLLSSDRIAESNILLRNQNYQDTSKNTSWLNMSPQNDSGTFKNTNRSSVQRPPYTTIITSETEKFDLETKTEDSLQQHGFTSGHQNNFGVPIEDDERILKILNDELVRLHNGTTTPRMSTTNRDEYRTKVSPTLPRTTEESVTERWNVSRSVNESECVSTSLPLCRGVMHYDLTSSQNGTSAGLTEEETVLFKYLLDSRCSTRAAQFMCSLFEPECRPVAESETLPPCKRFCKSVLEPCSQVVANSELLTELFDCDIYPESYDTCNDPTRYSKCLKNEFKCLDATCIPKKWKCDNIRDCRDGDDEDNCTFCEQDEFKCTENDKCIPADWRCDQYKDCPNGSDELDCIDDDSRGFPLGYGNARIYPYSQEVAPNAPNRRPYQTLSTEVRQKAADDQDNAYSHLSGRHILVSKSLANFQDSTEIMMTSDSETNYKYGQQADNNLHTIHKSPCPEGELRCLSGRCISLSQLCDKVNDCSDGSDELMCTTSTTAPT